MRHYCLKCGKELKENQLLCPHCDCCTYTQIIEGTMRESIIPGVLTPLQIEETMQWAKYRCGINGSAGHGFAAEDVNNLHDLLNGLNAHITGKNNAKNGPDRKIGDVGIQCKYYASAEKTLASLFENGQYKYYGQIAEVPSDQYEQVVELMRSRISKGEVPGFTDPNDAKCLIKRGAVTYKQARNLQKAGNIDSLKFDAATGAITATSSFGISFVVSLFCNMSSGLSKEEAVQLAMFSGLKSGTIALSSTILSAQILRTEFGRNLVVQFNQIAKNGFDSINQIEIGKKLISGFLKSHYGKSLSGNAARLSFIKTARLTAISQISVFLIMTIPDTYRLFNKEMSGSQFIKNMVVAGSGIGGTVLGTAIGGMLGPLGMMAGGFIGGLTTSLAAKVIADKISKDDSERMMALIRIAMIRLSNDYLIQTEGEFSRVMAIIRERKLITDDLLRLMYTIGRDDENDFLRVNVAYGKLDYAFSVVARQRASYHVSENAILDSLNHSSSQ